MTLVTCPHCQSPNDGRPNDGGLLRCVICGRSWTPQPGDGMAPPPLPAARSKPSGRLISAPSGEYLPDETPIDAIRALTSRIDAPAVPEPAQGSSSQRATPGSEHLRPHSDPLPRRHEVKPLTETPRRAQPTVPPPPPRQSVIDSDLFDRLEQEAQAGRARQDTIPEISFDAQPVEPGQVSCPVCGHGFAAVEGRQQRCPQCGSGFDTRSGRVSAGSDDGRRQQGDPLIGRTLAGCLIDRKIGEGGMGAVYHARQLSLDRSVAIKVLPPELARNRNFITRFEREAKSLARINHPNILHIYDFGDEAAMALYFMIIEFVEGKDLGDVLNRRSTLDQAMVLDLLRQAGLGLEKAAEAGVIHRDIKPDNLILGRDGVLRVMDFGLAKGYGAEVMVTGTGVRVGTPAFMSPEQCDGMDVDYRSDVYNLGATAYLCLTGRLPFDGDTPFSIMLKHKADPVPSVADHVEVDPRLDALVRRMLAKKPDDRCRSWHEIIDVVEAIQEDLGQGGRHSHPRLPALGSQPLPPKSPSPPRTAPAPVASDLGLGDGAVPEWLRPVDPQTGAALPHVASPPPVTAPVLPTPSPDVAAESLRPARSSKRLNLGLSAARDRGLASEAEALIASGDRLAASGRMDAAARDWQRAAELLPDPARSGELQARALTARRRGHARRLVHRTVYLALLLTLLAALGWLVPPQVHAFLAERELRTLVAQPDENVRRQALLEFAARESKPWPWYLRIFPQGYTVPAASEAADQAQRLGRTTTTPGTVRLAVVDLAGLKRAASDPAVPWEDVVHQAELLLPGTADATREQIERVRSAAAQQAAADHAAIATVESLVSTGRHREALAQAGPLRLARKRAGKMLDRLPLPALLDITADRQLDGDFQVSVDGTSLAAGERRICRRADRAVTVVVTAEGLEAARLDLPADPAQTEQILPVHLRRSPAWSLQPADGEAVAWLHGAADGVYLQLAARILRLDASGRIAATLPLSAEPDAQVPPLLVASGDELLLGTGAGQVLALDPAALAIIKSLHRGKGTPVAWTTFELTWQPGKQGRVVIERTGRAAVAVLLTDDGPRWRVDGLTCMQAPWVGHVGEQVVVVDDRTIRLIDEGSGAVTAIDLPAPRTAPAAHMPNAAMLLLPTTTRVEALRLTSPISLASESRLQALGPAQVAVDGTDLLVARADHAVDLLHWNGAALTPVWSHDQDRRAARPPVLTPGMAITADASGTLWLRHREDGRDLGRITHGSPLTAGPVFSGGQLIVYDIKGLITAYVP